MAEPRWLADEMVGRLARYLRFLGHDTVYVRGLEDDEIARRALREGRTLITRDRRLADRTPGALWLSSPELREQLRAVRASCPSAGYEVRFDRCTVCNGRLARVEAGQLTELPPSVRGSAGPVFRCTECGHAYWEGSHTRRIREELARTWGTAGP